MTGRYITETEKIGQRRRSNAYRKRLEEIGIRPRQLLLTDAEHEQAKRIIAAWRGELSGLDADSVEAAQKLRPNS